MNVQNQEVVIGIDGGGTHTRVMVADRTGKVLAYVEEGSSSIHKDKNAKHNVQLAIAKAIQAAGRNPQDVRALTAGLAGYDSEADLEWVVPLTALEGLDCPRQHVGDAIVAHSGALLSEPGIIVIAGTGSIIQAIPESGDSIRNYDLHHYARSAARFLAYDATYELLAGNTDASDLQLTKDILAFWERSSVQELALLAREGFVADHQKRNRKFGQLAPIVTTAAMEGSRAARLVCDHAAHQIVVGVEMLASYFDRPEVSVALIGSVAGSEYMKRTLGSRLEQGRNRSFRLVRPAFAPVAGAVMLALKQLDIPLLPDTLDNLRQHPQARHS